MNAVVAAVLIMLILSLARIHVVVALIVGAVSGGLIAGMSLNDTIDAFNNGLGGGAKVALSYAVLGAFAVAIGKSGLANLLAEKILAKVGRSEDHTAVKNVRFMIIAILVAIALSSQNILPIHIAFIPLVVPPLLYVMAKLKMDRRMVACALTFGLITPYMFIPVGFGDIYLNEILMAKISANGGDIEGLSVMKAMALPALGMLCGLLVAIFITYRGERNYNLSAITRTEKVTNTYKPMTLVMALAAIVVTFVVQLWLGSMILGALAGFLLFNLSGVVKWKEADDLFTEGMKMLAMIGFIMIAASGFAEVMRETGEITTLVQSSVDIIGANKALAALLMLLVGLMITLGIGSSFSTIPIIAALYVPMALEMGFSSMAIIALVGTAGALGDAGSPASDSTLGPTAGLNADGQHNHIWDSVVPTFLHFNLPLLGFGWVAAMVL
ncbi:MAG: Na+/H+ antiporter family protein [Marinobacter sp.]